MQNPDFGRWNLHKLTPLTTHWQINLDEGNGPSALSSVLITEEQSQDLFINLFLFPV